MAIARTVGEAEFRTLMLGPAKREVERRGSMVRFQLLFGQPYLLMSLNDPKQMSEQLGKK